MSPDRPQRHASQPIRDDDQDNINFRLDFLNLSEEDAARLKSVAPQFRSDLDDFVEVFYRHLFSHAQTAQFLTDPNLVTRLKLVQRAHLESMLESDWDQDYAESRHRVGRVHAREGIAPQWFIGGYNQYLQFWLKRNESEVDEETREHLLTMSSLIRVVMLDIGLTLDSYFHESTIQLRKALNLYWQVNTELRQFAQLASHDLKTPLATVANLCDEALDEFGEEMPAGAAELIEKARHRIFRMSSTIDELLEVAMQAEDSEIEQRINTRQLIADAVDEIRPLLDRNQVELKVLGEFPTVTTSRVHLAEILSNLLSNALKYMDKKPGKIEIQSQLIEEEWIFSVHDNGPGIAAEDCVRIFSPFLRLRAHHHVPGSGLGLYFAKNMVQQLQGRIWVESILGEESCFYVALPTSMVTDEEEEEVDEEE